tara:strand:- start:341 stop:616 length:276 start_codon:yes stop_codon:yes gene_type:complete
VANTVHILLNGKSVRDVIQANGIAIKADKLVTVNISNRDLPRVSKERMLNSIPHAVSVASVVLIDKYIIGKAKIKTKIIVGIIRYKGGEFL